MKYAMLGAACVLAAISLGSIPAQAADATRVERYHYGMHLDVQKLVALHEAPAQLCQLVEARMDYLDSQGKLRSLAYLKHSATCRDSN
ncbi:DUF2790 domain-containing protein [Pseudomonas sp. BN102]|uniref:DUF2790 domain-containing protein n=1 Tax=Pseudomonas sp. BN102 TaxID=2567886 RepID=UPI0024557F82|nr:DUF2790 domain-containing protein [Pseudomonas sp. BN102]MDH4608991.1 DUF2790 domain-containing protein [Pseudomonas sp. BN102]